MHEGIDFLRQLKTFSQLAKIEPTEKNKIADGNREKAAFSSHYGLFRTRKPFGLKIAPRTLFSVHLNSLVDGLIAVCAILPGQHCDIPGESRGIYGTAETLFWATLRYCCSNIFEKSELASSSSTYMCHVIHCGQLAASHRIIDAICDFKRPIEYHGIEIVLRPGKRLPTFCIQLCTNWGSSKQKIAKGSTDAFRKSCQRLVARLINTATKTDYLPVLSFSHNQVPTL